MVVRPMVVAVAAIVFLATAHIEMVITILLSTVGVFMANPLPIKLLFLRTMDRCCLVHRPVLLHVLLLFQRMSTIA